MASAQTIISEKPVSIVVDSVLLGILSMMVGTVSIFLACCILRSTSMYAMPAAVLSTLFLLGGIVAVMYGFFKIKK